MLVEQGLLYRESTKYVMVTEVHLKVMHGNTLTIKLKESKHREGNIN